MKQAIERNELTFETIGGIMPSISLNPEISRFRQGLHCWCSSSSERPLVTHVLQDGIASIQIRLCNG